MASGKPPCFNSSPGHNSEDTSTKKRLKCTYKLRGCKRAAPHYLDFASAESRKEFVPVGNSHGEALKDLAKALASAGL